MGRGVWDKTTENGKTFLRIIAGSGCRGQPPYETIAKAVWMPLVLTGWRNMSLSVLPARQFQPHYDKSALLFKTFYPLKNFPRRREGSYLHHLTACALRGATSAGQSHGGAQAAPTLCILQGKTWARSVSSTAGTRTDPIPENHGKRKSTPNDC